MLKNYVTSNPPVMRHGGQTHQLSNEILKGCGLTTVDNM
uniref:Uncharacterized protein n=1 Tax=Romanomermis culicivorax TaxID=13658 RepID=A0A915HRG8_ROMCU